MRSVRFISAEQSEVLNAPNVKKPVAPQQLALWQFLKSASIERYLPAALGVWAAPVVAANAFSPTNPYAAVLSNPLVLEFIAGAAAAIAMRTLGAKAGWTALAVGAIAVCIPPVLNSPLLEEQANSWRLVLFGMPAVCIVADAALVERHGGFRAPG